MEPDAADYAALVGGSESRCWVWSRPSFAGTPAPLFGATLGNLDVR